MMDVRRALVDLAKDRNRVIGISTKHEGGLIFDGRLEREFGTRKYADSHRTILRLAPLLAKALNREIIIENQLDPPGDRVAEVVGNSPADGSVLWSPDTCSLQDAYEPALVVFALWEFLQTHP